MLAAGLHQGGETKGSCTGLLVIGDETVVSDAFATGKGRADASDRGAKRCMMGDAQRAHFLSGPFLPLSLFSLSRASCSCLALAAFASSSFTRLVSSCQENMHPRKSGTLYVTGWHSFTIKSPVPASCAHAFTLMLFRSLQTSCCRTLMQFTLCAYMLFTVAAPGNQDGCYSWFARQTMHCRDGV